MKFIFLIMITLCAGCDSTKHPTPKENVYQVHKETLHRPLYFTGSIQPLKETSLTFPMDGVIETMRRHYGEIVKKDDVIVTVRSNELQKQYNETLTDYLKAKDSFMVANAKFIGTKKLWDEGLLAKNNFLTEKSALDTAHITLMQSTRKLKELIERIDEQDDDYDLSKLNIAEFSKIKDLLGKNHNLIHIKASNDGVLLYPPKSSEEKTGRLSVGSSVKSNQAFALIGDLTGISVEIDVTEIDIDKIHRGMKANITGVALNKEILHGKVVAVNAQASTNASNSLPSFNALVQVKTLTATQRAMIKIGMSASIEIIPDDQQHVMLPIAAIFQENGVSKVYLKTAEGALEARKIITGSADKDKVVVESGLVEGDQVVLNG